MANSVPHSQHLANTTTASSTGAGSEQSKPAISQRNGAPALSAAASDRPRTSTAARHLPHRSHAATVCSVCASTSTWDSAESSLSSSSSDASSSSSSSSSWELVEGRVYASVTRLGLTSGATNVIYSEYGSQRRARDAYYATGTGLTRIDGFCATDGGVTNNLPLFGDKLRPQLLVRTKGLAAIRDDMIARFSLADVDATVRLGQDDCVAFLERAAAAAPPSNGDCEKLPGDAVLVSPGGNIQLLPRGQTSI